MSEDAVVSVKPGGVPFVKMHGLGNDFIVIDADHLDCPEPEPAHVRRWCDRRLGIGADGVLIVRRVDGSADPPRLAMRIINANGSDGGMCGNGLRCLGRYAIERGLVDPSTTSVLVESGDRVIAIQIDGGADGDAMRLSADMGEPAFGPGAVRARVEHLQMHDEHTGRLELGSQAIDVDLVSIGNPHAVLFVDDISAFDIGRIGPAVEHHKAFPSGINLQIARIRHRGRIDMRTWERGAGPTLACGTGACAVAAAAMSRDAVEDRVELALPGGTLIVERRETGRLVLTGGAATVFTGRIGSRVGDDRLPSR